VRVLDLAQCLVLLLLLPAAALWSTAFCAHFGPVSCELCVGWGIMRRCVCGARVEECACLSSSSRRNYYCIDYAAGLSAAHSSAIPPQQRQVMNVYMLWGVLK